MRNFEGLKKAGHFHYEGLGDVVGELTLNGPRSVLEVFGEREFPDLKMRDIRGIFFDGSRISILQCVTSDRRQRFGHEGITHSSKEIPHLAVFGGSHVTSTEESISAVEIQFDDAPALFRGVRHFGALDGEALKNECLAELGGAADAIHLFYFKPGEEIFRTEVLFGWLSASSRASYRQPSMKGIRVENSVVFRFDYKESQSIDKVLDSVINLSCLMEVITGRRPNLESLRIFIGLDTKPLDVYWCYVPSRGDVSEENYLEDLLLKPFERPAEFMKVTANWLNRMPEWRDARLRFSQAFCSSTFDIDRIIGTANMFDVLPVLAVPKDVPLEPGITRAKEIARRAFKELPDSFERASVLGALGRLGRATLKAKVRHRGEVDYRCDRRPARRFRLCYFSGCRLQKFLHPWLKTQFRLFAKCRPFDFFYRNV